MNFKLKDKIELLPTDRVDLEALLRECAITMPMITHLANLLTDDGYHELCHQAYLYHLDDEWPLSTTAMATIGTFPVDDGEIHDKSIKKFENDGHTSSDSIMNWKKHLLVAKLLTSTLGWKIYSNTTTKLHFLR